MSKKPGAPRALPEHPNLENLKKQARGLLERARSGDQESLARFGEHHPRLDAKAIDATGLTLSDAQLVLAREYGFRSWPKLHHHVTRLQEEVGVGPAADAAALTQRLRRFARVTGMLSTRDLARLEEDLAPDELLALAVAYCPMEDRGALVEAGQLGKVVEALDAVIGAREPEPVGQGDPSAVQAASPCLAVLYCGGFPHLLGRRYPLGMGEHTLGRDRARDIVLNDDAISRLHCAITWEDGRHVMRDARSTNGTFVNEGPEPVAEHVMSDGDRIATGHAIMVYLAPDEGDTVQQLDSLERKYRAAVEYIATHDALTRVHNRRAWESRLEREVLYARGTDRPLSVVLLDIDEFKRHNDRLGHLAGNGLLLRVAQVLRERLEAGAIVGRYAGDEFVMALPGADLARGLSVAEELREAIAAQAVELAGNSVDVTISAGAATLFRTTGADELMADARVALAAAKRDGKNRVRAAA